MTHTAGFCYDIWNKMGRYMQHAGIPGIISCENKALTTPLVRGAKRRAFRLWHSGA